ncbi:MAG: spermidine/putrescine ABC transporter [Alphaproteobacteria bacterium]|nr:MAG: spermidine/putrescine ABC transporter [Alphaproteobacteria bacterium]
MTADRNSLGLQPTRRQFAASLASLGIAVAAVPLIGRGARAEPQMTFFTWGGYEVPEMHAAFIEKHGASPNIALFGDDEEGLQKVRAGYDPDVSHPCYSGIDRWRDSGVIQPIDPARLGNWPDLLPTFRNIEGVAVDGKQWLIPIDWGNTSIIYRADLVDIEEESWSLLWDERYAGRIAMSSATEDMAIPGALYMGAADPYNLTDAELEELREVFTKQRPLVKFYSNDDTTLQQALASGEVVAAVGWNSSYTALRRQGVPVKYMSPKEGIITWICGAVLMKDSAHVDEAYDFIDALIDPRTGVFVIQEFGFGHSNAKAYDMVGDDVLAEVGIPKDPEPMLAAALLSVDMKNKEAIERMLEKVRAGF